jgi:membrane protein implicated in regulation of membrane protease activity
MKKAIKNWLIVLATLVDDAAVLLVILLILWLLNIAISWVGIIFLLLLLGAVIFIMHKVIIPTLNRRVITGSEGMIGLEGMVVNPLEPRGMVRVGSEYWKARSTGRNIPAGDRVEVVAMDGLTLRVKPKQPQVIAAQICPDNTIN